MAHPSHNHQGQSPWSTVRQDAVARIFPPSQPIEHKLNVPGSKSFTNRALLLAGLAQGKSTLRGILRSDDSYWAVDCLRRLGVPVQLEDDTVTIYGSGGHWPVRSASLFIGSAGTLARFLPGALAVSKGKWSVDGSEQLRQRPLEPLLASLGDLGADIRFLRDKDELPFVVNGHGLSGGETEIPGSVSSQFLSGLLLCSPYARGPVTIRVPDAIVQQEYVRITLAMMQEFGVAVVHDENLTQFEVPSQPYQGRDTVLEADASTACYFFAAAAVTGGRVTVTNLNPTTYQPDARFVDILQRMGCQVERGTSTMTVQGPIRLSGGFTVSMKALSDQALTLAAIAPFADGPIHVTEVEHIRNHECDRIRAAVENLRRLGIRCDEHKDGLTVYPGKPRGGPLPSYDDHRVAMAFSILALRTENVAIQNAGCVSKTCPAFFQLLSAMGVEVRLESRGDITTEKKR